jgi:hypothetical protein
MVPMAKEPPCFGRWIKRLMHQILEHWNWAVGEHITNWFISVCSSMESLWKRNSFFSWLYQQSTLHLEVSSNEEDCRSERTYKPSTAFGIEPWRHNSGKRSSRWNLKVLESLSANPKFTIKVSKRPIKRQWMWIELWWLRHNNDRL